MGLERFAHEQVLFPFLVEMCWSQAKGTRTRPVADVCFTQTTLQSTGLVVPPFLVEYYGTSTVRALSAPLSTVESVPHHGMVVPSRRPDAFLMSYYGTAIYRPLHDPVGTCTSRDRHALITLPQAHHQETPSVDDYGFRMLTLPEIKKAMGFPDSYTIVCTSAKEGVRQCGLAVTPAVAAELVRRGIESLGYHSLMNSQACEVQA
jgi:DNA (cytosine-5)-methyltransferase 1